VHDGEKNGASLEIIEVVRSELGSASTVARYRARPQDWTRRRKLSFVMVAVLILRGHKLSIPNALNKLFSSLGLTERIATPGAYRKARAKLKPELFVHLNQVTVAKFYDVYGRQGRLRRWKGYRVVAADGTYLQLPDTPETRARFTVQTNQVPGFSCVQALASVLYDVLDDVGLHIVLAPASSEAELLIDKQAGQYGDGDLIVLDRLYADYSVFAALAHERRRFVVRCARRGLEPIRQFWEAEQHEAVVTLRAPAAARQKATARGWPLEVRVRLVKVELETGEVEMLATNLLGQEQATRDELKQLYGLRWGVETYFGRIKGVFEVERFSGQALHVIEQDIYGTIFLATLESALSRPADEELAEESRQRSHAYVQGVNRATSSAALLDEAVALLADPTADTEQILDRLHQLFKTGPSLRRPGRHRPRAKLTPSRRLRFYRYRKRIVA
jgi:hypothetical protein